MARTKQKTTKKTQKKQNNNIQPQNQEQSKQNRNKSNTKKSIFNTFETMPDTPKTNLLILKPQKKQTQKTPFCHVQKQPTIFHKFSVFSTYSFCFWKAVFCWKHYKNSVFRKTQLFKNTVSKTHFFNHVKTHLFPKEGVIFVFCNFRWNPYFYRSLCFALFWSKKFLAKTDSVHENALFSPFLTQIVSGNFR